MDNDTLKELKTILEIHENKIGECFAYECKNQAIHHYPTLESKTITGLYEKDNENKKTIFYLKDNPEYTPEFMSKKSSKNKNSKRKLVSRSIEKPSVLIGLCNKHNHKLFDELDHTPYKNEDKINFLHAYRAYASYASKSKNQFSLGCYEMLDIIENNEEQMTPLKESLPITVQKVLDDIPDDFFIAFGTMEPLTKVLDQVVETIEDSEFNELITHLQEQINNINLYPMTAIDFKTKIKHLVYSICLSDNCPVTRSKYDLNFFIKMLEGIRELENKLNLILLRKEYSEMTFSSRSLKGIYGITGSFVYKLSSEKLVTLSIFPDYENERTQILQSGFKADGIDFMKIKGMDELEYRQFISVLIADGGSNIFMSPSFFYNLDIDIQSRFLDKKSDSDGERINIFTESTEYGYKGEVGLN